VTDLFPCTCPHCGQQMPDKQEGRFGAWWAEYPSRGGRKVGKAKAEEHYRKAARLVSEDLLLGAVKSYAANCKRTDTFPVDAFRWLRDRRWVDESLTPSTQTEDALQWWANQINSGRKLFSLPSRELMAKMVEARIVSPDRIRELEA
jgi:hypothetical protein